MKANKHSSDTKLSFGNSFYLSTWWQETEDKGRRVIVNEEKMR